MKKISTNILLIIFILSIVFLYSQKIFAFSEDQFNDMTDEFLGSNTSTGDSDWTTVDSSDTYTYTPYDYGYDTSSDSSFYDYYNYYYSDTAPFEYGTVEPSTYGDASSGTQMVIYPEAMPEAGTNTIVDIKQGSPYYGKQVSQNYINWENQYTSEQLQNSPQLRQELVNFYSDSQRISDIMGAGATPDLTETLGGNAASGITEITAANNILNAPNNDTYLKQIDQGLDEINNSIKQGDFSNSDVWKEMTSNPSFSEFASKSISDNSVILHDLKTGNWVQVGINYVTGELSKIPYNQNLVNNAKNTFKSLAGGASTLAANKLNSFLSSANANLDPKTNALTDKITGQALGILNAFKDAMGNVIGYAFNGISSLATAGASGDPFTTSAANSNLSGWIKSTYSWALGIAAGLATLILIYAGYLYSTSAGNPEQVNSAKEYIIGALSGLAFLLLAGIIYNSIKVNPSSMGGGTSSANSTWNVYQKVVEPGETF